MPHLYRILVLMLLSSATITAAEEKLPSARLQFKGSSFGVLVGYTQGEGTLRFQGMQYPFSVQGLGLATLGVSHLDATGVVYNLSDVSDFAGQYVAAKGSFTLGQGGGSAALKNQNDVVIFLQTYQLGVKLSLGLGGFTIALDQPDAKQPTADSSVAD